LFAEIRKSAVPFFRWREKVTHASPLSLTYIPVNSSLNPAIEQLCTVLSAGCTEELTRYQKFMSCFHLYGGHNMAAEAGGCYQVDRESG